ncbi:MAG TPA: hypothetical protein VHS31_08955, partial [Tepidisphaeraceae bacterium]|nr:hypothetical protein [Tepidisphaeraceae bacterium]
MAQTLEMRIGLIERRVGRIEERLDLRPLEEGAERSTSRLDALREDWSRLPRHAELASPAPVEEVVPMAMPVDATPAPAMTPPPLPKSLVAEKLPSPDRVDADAPSWPESAAVQLPSLQPLAREVLPYVPRKPKKPAKQGALEQTIGL